MGLILAACCYAALLAFLGGIFSRFLLLWKSAGSMSAAGPPEPKLTACAFLRTTGDVLFLGRLLKTNDVLWPGEWMFHVSFVFVFLRHLRYFLDPVPGWTAFLQPAGIAAGYLLPAALAYILIVKPVIERGYFSSYNFFLLVLILSTGLTGILLRTAFRTDLVAVKLFMLGIFGFSPAPAPGGLLFAVHFLLALLVLIFLPSHVLAAPFVMLEARRHEDGLKKLLREK